MSKKTLTQKRRFFPQLEVLEDRLAPAALLSPTTLIYHDSDGDLVTVKISKPLPAAVDPNTVFGFDVGNVDATLPNQKLWTIDLGPLATNGLSVKVTAKQNPGGNGLADVGFIHASGFDVASVSIPGDLGGIGAGDAELSTRALGTLRCQSMGVAGLPYQSGVNGNFGKLQVAGTIEGSLIRVNGNIASVAVGGSLNGGVITAQGKISRVTIGGALDGSNGGGQILSHAGLGPVTIGGSMTGGSGDSSGSVVTTAGNLTRIKVAGNVIGGGGLLSGAINAFGNIGPVSVGGVIIGGAGITSGGIYATTGNIGPIYVFDSIFGGGGLGSGAIVADGQIASLRIAEIRNGASIRAGDCLGPITALLIQGAATSPVTISARGQPVQSATKDLAIAKLTVAGIVEYANILAGYDVFGGAVNADAQIGPIIVGGNWKCSSVAAGAKTGDPATSDDGYFGTLDDIPIPGGSSTILSKIAGVTIKGHLITSGFDTFGLVAEQVVSLRIGGDSIALTTGAHNDHHVDLASSLFVNEV